ncbi:MAG: hypothetical protein B6U88_01340 [Candidatus Aenigmarchaeota archaeon ex4484_56]|nr:MAG: hypothetical protein B6U88_01340 [Candidatus Aenigmarchaeota archaeon ex4484_56]
MMRPDKDRYYINIAKEVSKRSTCISARFGAVIVREDQIVSTGYNGAPRKVRDCFEIGMCLRRKLKIPSGKNYEICRSVHAEMNCIINAARSGVSILGGDLYLYGIRVLNKENQIIDAFPCFICKKMIINSGLSRIICSRKDNSYKIYFVKDWVNEWKEKDMLEEIEQYKNEYFQEK